jgi:hypothetical protein
MLFIGTNLDIRLERYPHAERAYRLTPLRKTKEAQSVGQDTD